MNTKEVGRFGEDLAVKFLEQNHFLILQRNFKREVSRFLKSEIDIIAKKQRAIHFIEVKTSTREKEYFSGGFYFFSPEQRVDFKKQRKLIKSAEAWLAQNKIAFDSSWQIDIISIVIDSDFDFKRQDFNFKKPNIQEPNFLEFNLRGVKLSYFQNIASS